MSTPLEQRLRPRPAARYVHPKALASPELAGQHDANLDVADEQAPNYLKWIADLITPYLGHSVLELGAGTGSITKLYVDGRRVVATDLSDDCVAALRQRFRDAMNVEVAQKDLRQLGDGGERFDSIVMINVLEHIQDDVGTLERLRPLLSTNGAVILYVPALNGLYGRWDRKVGHYRRYSKWRLREIAREAGMDVVELRYANILAIPAWFAFSRTDVERTTSASLSIWDRTGVLVGRALEERVRVPVGLNVLAVLRAAR